MPRLRIPLRRQNFRSRLSWYHGTELRGAVRL
eukprot:SAG11_NODE_24208_length_376_cov_3.613718_1_plen_31_part_01